MINLISKSLAVPETLFQLSSLKNRLHPSNSNLASVYSDIEKREAGHKGEKIAEYYVRLIDSEQINIFHGLRLRTPKGHFFQIDLLLVSPQFHILFEVKYQRGNLQLNPQTKEYTQELNGEVKKIANPFEQSNLHAYLLKLWLDARGVQEVPIYHYIVNAHPQSFFTINPSDLKIASHFISPKGIVQEYSKVHKSTQFKSALNNSQMNNLTNQLIENHEELYLNIFSNYSIKKTEIQRGLICVYCGSFHVEKKGNQFKCHECKRNSSLSGRNGLKDQYLIFRKELTPTSVQEFLDLDTRYQAYRLLESNYEKKIIRQGKAFYIPKL
ncbi:hypothetical protein Q73_09965 [Bacillus coahuilensis m2-6]|uniref:nuclease-related domain-containing protein n=1 Tax=Bacillus coahuilensis TaxID=408580 RepID=UPI0007505C3E|nr:nuclease-related domain-containing protein [Bacillus coahuilensis]KUP07292.1 hypothetical protein Q73_09965 [Bacillus coahuilensis m2-6]